VNNLLKIIIKDGLTLFLILFTITIIYVSLMLLLGLDDIFVFGYIPVFFIGLFGSPYVQGYIFKKLCKNKYYIDVRTIHTYYQVKFYYVIGNLLSDERSNLIKLEDIPKICDEYISEFEVKRVNYNITRGKDNINAMLNDTKYL
jgi:hypothetical protein